MYADDFISIAIFPYLTSTASHSTLGSSVKPKTYETKNSAKIDRFLLLKISE